MEIIIAKIYLIIVGIVTVCSVDKPRRPLGGIEAVFGLLILGFFYYLISY